VVPDGKRIVFSTVRYSDLRVIRADGTSLNRMTRLPKGVGDTSPSWSPDGKRIAFVRWTDFSADVLVMAPDGSHVRQVTTNCECRTPARTPDGKRILFSARYGGDPDVFSIGADGTGLRALLRTPASEVEVGTAR
jgi:TolB protein